MGYLRTSGDTFGAFDLNAPQASAPTRPRGAVSWRPQRLEVAPRRLLTLDRFEQRLEVAFAEALAALALDDLEEERRTVADRTRENLQQVAVVIAVDEDVERTQPIEVLVDAGGAVTERVVVGPRGGQELHTAVAHLLHGARDVIRVHGDVLDTAAPVVVEILLDLRLLEPDVRLVDRHGDLCAGVTGDLGAKRAVLGRDVLFVEFLEHGE